MLYNVLLFIGFFLSIPRLILQRKKYQGTWGKRLGKGFPIIHKGEKRLLWVHAVSVGETRAIAPLATMFEQEGWLLLVTTCSSTGLAEAKRLLPYAEGHALLPLDFSWVIGPILKRIRPDRVLLAESDFWRNFLRFSKAEGADIILANGKMSDQSFARFKRFPFFSRPLFQLFDLICSQNEVYTTRFRALGAPHVVTTGNLKVEAPIDSLSFAEISHLKKLYHIEGPSLTLGSTHAPEEKELLSALKPLWKAYPDFRLLVVPRHPERFDEVEKLLLEEGFTVSRLSQGSQPSQILLIDKMGHLRTCYQLTDISIVAGSYTTKVGGHNILEPLFYGKPTFYGPHMWSQKDFHLLYPEGETPLPHLFTRVQEALTDPCRQRHQLEQLTSNLGYAKLTSKELIDELDTPRK